MSVTAEYLRAVHEAYFQDGVRYPIVLGYDTQKDPHGIIERDAIIAGDGNEWIVYSNPLMSP